MNEPVYGSCLDIDEVIRLAATPDPQPEEAVKKDPSEPEKEDESELYFNKRR